MTPTCNSYFSGAGGLDLGLMEAGIKILQSLDLDKRATDCMKENSHYFSHKIVQSDIKDELVEKQPKSDIMSFTYPCKRYSSIADIHNVRTGDELFLHALRMVAIYRPEMYLVENVPGMRKFKVVMEAMTKLPDYYVNVFCPVNASNWLPQQRKRLILIGTKKPFLIASPNAVNNRPRLKDLLESDPEVDMPDYVLSRIKGKYRDKPIIIDPELPGAIAPTCLAHYAKDLGTRLVKDRKAKDGLRPFTVREYARLQGFPDDFKFKNTRSSYELIGNAVAVHMGKWMGNTAMKYFN